MSNINYLVDGEQATAAILNRPIKDVQRAGQYMSKTQFEANAAQNREIYAGSGVIQKSTITYNSPRFFDGMHASCSTDQNSGDVNTFCLNTQDWTGSTDKKDLIFNVNGVAIKHKGLSVNTHGYNNIISVDKASDLKAVETNQLSTTEEYKKNDFIYLQPGTNICKYGDFDTQEKLDQFIGHTNSNGNVSWDDANNRLAIIKSDCVENEIVWTEDAGNLNYLRDVRYRITYTVDIIKGQSVKVYNTHLNDTVYMYDVKTVSGTYSKEINVSSPIGIGFDGKADSNGDIEVYFSNVKVEIIQPAILSITNSIAAGSELNNDNCFKVDSISRQDYILMEAWHEDVSDKDFVYPYGNIQYTSNSNVDGIGGIIQGSFSGADTYSLLGEWQEDGVLIGNGYVWSTMSTTDKLKFAKNPYNNIYQDEDKIIQVRYRTRVVKGLRDHWTLRPRGGGAIDNVRRLRPRMQSNPKTDLNPISTGSTFFQGGRETNKNYVRNKEFRFPMNGVHKPGTSGYAGEYNLGLAIPIALVQRRNIGAYDPVHNPEGSAVFSDGKQWFETADSHSSIVDCFNNKGDSTVISGISGRPDNLFSDELNYRDIKDLRMNAQKVTDLTDVLEKNWNKVISDKVRGTESIKRYSKYAYIKNRGAGDDSNFINFDFVDKDGRLLKIDVDNATTGSQDGKHYGIYLKMLTGDYVTEDGGNGAGIINIRYIRTSASVLHCYDFENGNGDLRKIKQGDKFEIYKIDTKWFLNDVERNTYFFTDRIYSKSEFNLSTTKSIILGDPRKLKERVKYTVIDGTSQIVDIKENDYVLNDDGYYYRSISERDAVDLDTDDFSASSNWANLDTDGNIGGYPSSLTESSIVSQPFLLDNSDKPGYLVNAVNSTYYKYLILRDKFTVVQKAIMYYSNGDVVELIARNVSSDVNTNSFETGGSTNAEQSSNRFYWNTVDNRYDEHAIMEVFYETPSNFIVNDSLKEMLVMGDGFARRGSWKYHGNILQNHLLGYCDISSNTTTKGDVMQNFKINNYTKYYGSSNPRLVIGGWGLDIEHVEAKTTRHLHYMKTVPMLSYAGGQLKLDVAYKEVKYDDTNDNDNIVDVLSTDSIVVEKGNLYRIKFDQEITIGSKTYPVENGKVTIDGTDYTVTNGIVIVDEETFNTKGPSFIVQALLTGTSSSLWSSYTIQDDVIYGGTGLPSGFIKLWDGNGFGDNNKFGIEYAKSHMTDDNNNIVQQGVQSVFIPYFID